MTIPMERCRNSRSLTKYFCNPSAKGWLSAEPSPQRQGSNASKKVKQWRHCLLPVTFEVWSLVCFAASSGSWSSLSFRSPLLASGRWWLEWCHMICNLGMAKILLINPKWTTNVPATAMKLNIPDPGAPLPLQQSSQEFRQGTHTYTYIYIYH